MKFDITKLTGYRPDMTAEEQLKLFADADFDVVSKATYDKTASEAAGFKKQLNARLSEEEQRANADREAREADAARIKELERRVALNDYKAKFLGVGFTPENAEKAATAYADGQTDAIFAMLGDFKNAVTANAQAELLKKTPQMNGGTGGEAPVTDYAKLIAEANDKQDYGKAAYYMRLQQMQNNND